MKSKILFLALVTAFSSIVSCSKETDAEDAEEEAIEKLINSHDTLFFTLINGIYLHIDVDTTDSIVRSDQPFNDGDSVRIVINSAKTLENTVNFASKDTITTIYPSKELLKGWQIALQNLTKQSSGVLVIPYKLAFGDKRTGLIEPYSTLYYDFFVY